MRIAQRLADSDNAEWQRDLSYSSTAIAHLLMKQEEWAKALPLLEKSLVIGERLAASDLSNVTWQNDVRVIRRLVEQVRKKI